MDSVAVTLFLIGAVGSLIYLYLSWNFDFWKKRGIIGPRPSLFYGNLPSVVNRKRHLAFDLQDLYEEYKNSGQRFVGIFSKRNPRILVTDPKAIREVLISNFKNIRSNDTAWRVNRRVEKISINNPFFCPFQDWKERRTDVVGGLTANRLKLASPIVLEACRKMINFVKSSSEKSIEVKALSYNFTIEVASDFIWGISSNSYAPENGPNTILKTARDLLNTSFRRSWFDYLYSLAPFLRRFSNSRLFSEEFDNFFTEIQKSAEEMRSRNPSDRPDFLNYLKQLQEKKGISLEERVGYSLTVLLDGFETNGSVMYHALHDLASNQMVQQKLRDEILANLDEHGQISSETLLELPFLEQCFHESIRLNSPIPTYSKMCTEESFLEYADNKTTKINPGMVIHIPINAIHHDPDIYTNPYYYNPERFDNGRAKELIQKGCFLPFGDGPRICLGMRLGQLVVKTGIFHLIKNFKLSVNEGGREKKIDPDYLLFGLAGDVLIDFESIK